MAYADTTELARILKIRTPSAEQLIALQRVLDVASLEEDREIDRPADAEDLTAGELALLAEVCLERAVEHWGQQENAFGVIGIGADIAVPVRLDTWERHAMKLAPLKLQWGLA